MQDTLTRSFALQAGAIDEENRRIRFTFSSEYPFDRGDYIEVLSHAPGAVNLDRLARGGGAFVNGHDLDAYLGDVIEARIENGKGHAVAQFSESPEAEIVWQDVRKGLRQNISVGYLITESVMEPGRGANAKPTRRVTRWEPYELSSVPVPIDPTVGIGRRALTTNEKRPMTEKQIEHEAREAWNNKRMAEIRGNAKKFGKEAEGERACKDGMPLDEFINSMTRGWREMPPVSAAFFPPDPSQMDAYGSYTTTGNLGVNGRDLDRYSFTKLIAEGAERSLSGLERELHQEMVTKGHQPASGEVLVPEDVLRHRAFSGGTGRRDMLAGVDASGGFTIQETTSSSFTELLRAASLIYELGATPIEGLSGPYSEPKLESGVTAYWLGEGETVTESSPTWGAVRMRPKRVVAHVDFSDVMEVGNPATESRLKMIIAAQLAQAIDIAAINGDGAGSTPLGILGTAGIGTIEAGDPDGAAVTYADLINLEGEIDVDNAMLGAPAFLTNTSVKKKLRQTLRETTNGSDFIFEPDPSDRRFGLVAGYRCGISNNVPNTLTKGSGTALSAIILGVWQELLLGSWGGLRVKVDPFTGIKEGLTGLNVTRMADVVVRNAEAFAAIDDIVTT